MPGAPDLGSLTAAAASAAAANDYHTAIACLHRVLAQQGAILGPGHPDLATTLNNLALMLERSGDVAGAGQCYQRAYAIAAATRPPDDPLVRVSEENLHAFRLAHGQPGTSTGPVPTGTLMDFPAATERLPPSPEQPLPSPPPGPSTPPGARAAHHLFPPAAPPAARDPFPAAVPSTRSRAPSSGASAEPSPLAPSPALRPRAGWSGPKLMAWVGAALLLAGLAIFWRPASEPAGAGAASQPAAAPSAAEAGSGSDTPAPVVDGPPPPSNSSAVGPSTAGATRERAESQQAGGVVPAPSRPPTKADGQGPGLAEAEVCRTLSRTGGAWRCEPVTGPLRGGAVYYYTRVRSPRDIVVRHRWSRGGRIVRVSSLRIGANPAAGFRTFSRYAIEGAEPGEWQVELVGPDERVLDQRRFVVE